MTQRKMMYVDRWELRYGYLLTGYPDKEGCRITCFGTDRRLDGLECDYKGFRYLLTKAETADEKQRLRLESAEEEISQTHAEVHVAKCGLRFDMADKRRSIRRGCTHPDE